ncbi:MAG: S24 family peptidase [Deltaproteobacteria bacterium]|nr:S24 family peptidase [Deltaproteobacteria bacterium]
MHKRDIPKEGSGLISFYPVGAHYSPVEAHQGIPVLSVKRKSRIKNELIPVRNRIWKLVEELAGGKPGTFAKKANVHNSVIENVRDNVSLPVVENLIKICNFANVSADYILFGKKPPTFQPLQPIITIVGKYPDVPSDLRTEDYLAVPLVEGYIAAGYEGTIPEEYIISLVWVYRPEIGKRQYHDLRAVRLGKNAESMRRTLKPGDIIIVDPTEKPPAKPLVQKGIYAVRVDEEGGCAVKRVREKDDFWILLSDNPEYDPILIKKDAKYNPIIGRVIWSWTSWVK